MRADELIFQWPKGSVHLLSNRINSTANSKDYIDWAVNALLDKFETPSLVLLAGLDLDKNISIFDAENYFEKCLQELKLSLPNDGTILRLHLSEISKNIAEEAINPIEGINLIHQRIINPLNHPEDLMPWCFLWEGNSSSGDYAEYSEDEQSNAIVDYAKTWNKKV